MPLSKFKGRMYSTDTGIDYPILSLESIGSIPGYLLNNALEALAPSMIKSIKKAMQTYARQGGTLTIFINDDGLRAIPAPDRRDEHISYANIGWVARV
ncbi:hypothetical protein HGRIS_000010 [Hohenbuehelia grisea]|uniref:Uncharacterized protein n=1 Tax=Hohenbuehelia grisea TaxID=104357 RepID=A0ABR3JRQ5_9AGAR